jgi:hypothetical protein
VDSNVGPDLLVNWKRVAFPLAGGWLATRGTTPERPAMMSPQPPTARIDPTGDPRGAPQGDLQGDLLRVLAEELERAR